MPTHNQYIYVVDHNGINSALLKLNYTSNGYQYKVRAFQSINACLKEVRKNAPLIVLIDSQHLSSGFFALAFRRVSKIIDQSVTIVRLFSSTSELHSTIREVISQIENSQLDGPEKVSALAIEAGNHQDLYTYTGLLFRRNMRRLGVCCLFSITLVLGVMYCGSGDINSVFFLSFVLILLIAYFLYVLFTSRGLKIRAKL
jgi:hypothetical protein